LKNECDVISHVTAPIEKVREQRMRKFLDGIRNRQRNDTVRTCWECDSNFRTGEKHISRQIFKCNQSAIKCRCVL